MREKRVKLLLIQALRGMAAMLILIHHGSEVGRHYLGYEYFYDIFDSGWIGVDFFFVLSGFMLFYVSSKDIGNKKKIKNFYLKRFIRVYPLYWIVTLSLLVVFFVIPSLGIGYETNLDVILKSILLLPQVHYPILSVGWSLVFEMFFYSLFGLLIYAKSKYSIPILGLWFVGVLLNSFGVIILNGHFYLEFIFSNYFLQFVLGSFAGYLVLNKEIKHPYILMTIGASGFLTGWYLLLNGVLERYQTSSLIVFGLSFSLIILSAAVLDLRYRIKVPKILILLGDASYSIYLTHYYVLIFLFKVLSALQAFNPFNEFVSISLILIVTTILGVLFHFVVEKPVITFLNNTILKRKPKPDNELEVSLK